MGSEPCSQKKVPSVMGADSLRAKIRQVVDEQERFCKDVQAAVAVSREINVK